MAHRHVSDSRAQTVHLGDSIYQHPPQTKSGAARLGDYLGLLALAALGVILVGVLSSVFFGSSVLTAL